jgi:hypothetical protein
MEENRLRCIRTYMTMYPRYFIYFGSKVMYDEVVNAELRK